MQRNFMKTIAGLGLLFFGMSIGPALAQDRDRDEDSFHRGRDTWFQGDTWRMRLFERVRDDLDHVQVMHPAFGDRYRLSRTKQELNDLQDKLAARRYDQPELDRTIAALERVVRDNDLTPRDREILNDDLNRMRDYRERHDAWIR